MLYYRHRHGHYALAQPSPVTRFIRPVLGLIVFVLVLYFAGSWLMGKLGIGNHTRQTAVELLVEKSGGVQVSLEGKEFASAQNGMKLYASDRVKTAANSNAALQFFDGSLTRFDGQTEVEVLGSDLKSQNSTISLNLKSGSLWVSTPSPTMFTGSIIRTVSTEAVSFEIPAQTEAVLSGRSVTVFSAAGLGIKVIVPKAVIPVIVGVGQKFTLPESFKIGEDLYQYRSPIGTVASLPTFVESSRTLYHSGKRSGKAVTAAQEVAEGRAISVTNPKNNATVQTATVKVEGSVSDAVASLRINGYQARLNTDKTFSVEVTLPDEDKATVTIEALDSNGNALDTVTRQINRNRKAPVSPTIVSPAKDGQTYRTQASSFEIKGKAPADAAGIVVNDYRLQLFKPESGEWSYLASAKLGNIHDGENVFTVYSVNQAGLKSPSVTLTVLIGGEGEGVVSAASSQSGSVKSEVAETELPKNAPLLPGTLTVTAPQAGTEYAAGTGSILIEGATAKETASVWVNGYKLRLYTPGKIFWNYIADTTFGNLKKGTNVYVVNARNAEGKLIDSLTYTVTY